MALPVLPPLPAELPAEFDAEFLADCPYDPTQVFFFDKILELDREKKRVVCSMPTHDELPITRAQRAHPVRHPRHVAGAIMIHATGMLGFVHAYYMLGLRHRDGWIGYGTHIHRVVFRKLVPPGEPIVATLDVTRQRLGKSRHFIRYAFEFRHQGDVCYEGDQTAVWMNVHEASASPTEGPTAGPTDGAEASA